MHRSAAGLWMGVAFSVAFAVAATVLVHLGAGKPGTYTALHLTARCSYLFFWPAYAGGALAALFGPTFQPLAQRGRELGLAFASAHSVHVAVVVWLYHISVRPPVSTGSLMVFGAAVFWMYLLALLSIRRLSAALPPAIWRSIRTLGMEYIALAFLDDFAKNPFSGNAQHFIAYFPFLALAVAGPALRIAAFVRRLGEPRKLVF